ncbi:hypothetical protein AVEN_235398-1 [Araneus ventricosus]|uniref:Tc1-like transposase DDE domain-containing protein n=1 Tax=Araneus ventricosus TaxID=182803 RepID=A0A4Y2A3M2_ARAVE|nr:hypothetical protein AVEN_235398-1 [Araneus ventricosus]
MRDRCRLGGNVHGHSTSFSVRTEGFIITTDEAWIYLSDTDAKSKVQHLSSDQNRRDLTPSTTVPHPKGVMVWMGISANSITKPRFVQPGAKTNSEYYIHKILKPFLKDDCCRLYPNGDVVFHQDSAPSHTCTHLESPRNSSWISKCNS